MDVQVVLPTRRFVTYNQWYRNMLVGDNGVDCCKNGSHAHIMYVLPIVQSGVVWREVDPCLFQGCKRDARRLLYCMFDQVMNSCARMIPEHQINQETLNWKDEQSFRDYDTGLKERESLRVLLHQRKLRLSVSRKAKKRWKIPYPRKRSSILIWIQPPTVVRFEYLFEGLLIQWEHDLIRAQSLAGYFSTLGGGFFMCHHWRSAVQLAQHQQLMAALLNDWPMYYKCQLNQAYNWIYAGKFKIAKKLIDQVQQAAEEWARRHGGRPLDRALLPMCSSARLFYRRVRKCARKLANQQQKSVSITNGLEAHSSNGKSGNRTVTRRVFSKTMDDFARIRIREDQSSALDLVKPFS